MENKKAKNLIIAILIVLLLVCLGVVVWQYIKINNTSSNQEGMMGETNNPPIHQENIEKEENKNTENKQPEENKNTENTKTEVEENQFDPYANYKNLNWSTTSASAGTITSANIKISNGKVYVTYQEEVEEVTGIEGTPIKVAYTPGSMLWFEVLTKEGKVYSISDWDTKAELYISKYNIIDMTTYAGEETAHPIYYLTAEGKLINNNGKEVSNVDPYANYRNINWAYRSATSRTGAKILIDLDNTVIVTYENGNKEVTGIKGTPIKAISTIGGGIPFFYVLTSEGRVYNLEEGDTEAILVADLSKYDIIDMTPHIKGNDTYSLMCYLTTNGSIIDSNGNSYKIN